MRRKFPFLLTVLAAIVAAAATSVVSLAQSNAGAGAPAGAQPANRIAALGRPQQSDDRLPAGIQAKFGTANADGPHVDPASARKVARLGDADIYVAEGPNSLCTIRSGADGWAGGCSDRGLASSGTPQVTATLGETAGGNDYQVWGVAPGNVKAVAVQLSDGTSVPGTITDGAFSIVTDDPGATFVWTGDDGTERSQPLKWPPAHPDAG